MAPAPSFDHLREADLDEEEFDEDEIDISDLREKYEVQLEHGYDTFIVVDGLPEVTEEQKPRLVKFLMKKFNAVGSTREEAIYMPFGDNGKSLRYVLEILGRWGADLGNKEGILGNEMRNTEKKAGRRKRDDGENGALQQSVKLSVGV